MKKAPDAFRTISEVADWLDVQAHVLRFWESKFTQVKPVKRAGGRRYYRPTDMLLIGGIKTLLHDEGMTIKGVQKILREKGVDHVAEMSRPLETDEAEDIEEAIDGTAASVSDLPVVEPVGQQAGAAEAPAEADSADTDAPDAVAEAPMQEAAEPEPLPNVVAFQSRKSRPAPPAEDSQEAQADSPEAEDETEVEAAEAAAPQPEPQPDADPDTDADTAADADTDTRADSPPEAEPPSKAARRPSAERDLFDDLPDQPNLPSFLHKSAMASSEPAPEPEPEPAQDPAPAAPRARVVEAADPPADDEITAQPGPLGQLAALDHLPGDTIADLTGLAADLRALAAARTGASAP